MDIVNIHQRRLPGSPEQVGALLDTLASREDAVWPHRCWPRMRLDGPLQVGAAGGHGPIRYTVEAYEPGRRVRFRFTAPEGFNGWHELAVMNADQDGTVLRHMLQMSTRGLAILSWPLVFRPLHDALLEDALATAEAALGRPPYVVPWSPWVRLLRWLASRGKATAQAVPESRVLDA